MELLIPGAPLSLGERTECWKSGSQVEDSLRHRWEVKCFTGLFYTPLAPTVVAFCRGFIVGDNWGIYLLSCLKSSLERIHGHNSKSLGPMCSICTGKEKVRGVALCVRHGMASISPLINQSRENAICPKVHAVSVLT